MLEISTLLYCMTWLGNYLQVAWYAYCSPQGSRPCVSSQGVDSFFSPSFEPPSIFQNCLYYVYSQLELSSLAASDAMKAKGISLDKPEVTRSALGHHSDIIKNQAQEIQILKDQLDSC